MIKQRKEGDSVKVLASKIWEALLSALPITLIVYIMALLPWFAISAQELLTFTISAVMLIVGIGLFNMGGFCWMKSTKSLVE